MIYHLLNSLLIGILFADLLERRFPAQFRSILTDVTFNAIYFYSKAQIYITKVHKKINEIVESNPTLLKIKNELEAIMKSDKKMIVMNEFIKDGERLSLEESSACDFALFSWLSDDKKCVNKKIVYDINEPMTTAECSDIKFMLIEIQMGENKFKVDLKTDNYNFYLVGNKFTKQFFIYYLKQHLQINQSINYNGKFILKIIDHNVIPLSVNFTEKNESVILEKSRYKIVNNE
jgi:hypothetical protein